MNKMIVLMMMCCWIVAGAAAAADDGAKGGDKTANTAAVSARLPIGPPVIGAWFPEENEMRNPDGYRDFLDAAAGYSHYTLLSTTMRIPGRQMTDAYVHDWFKRAAAYARQRGVGLVLELDPRHSIPAFAQQYPKALQQRLWLREVDLAKEGNAEVDMHYQQGNGDAICKAGVNAIALERVYVYERTSAGIEPSTVQDATASCTVRDTGTGKRSVFIPSGNAGSKERKACVIMRVTFNYPALFSPEILQFEADTVRQYADLPLAGLMKDEAGYPAAHDGNPHKNGFWTSTWREADYARRTGGRGLVRDSLLMCFGEAGREAERQSAINHFMEQSRHRNSVIEQAFYKQTKATFGPDAFVGTHDTVFPYPDAREFERNGLNWWTATRDYAQSDEVTPYSCRTSMAKKMGGGVWYNQWYSPDIATYEKGIWRYALAGGRMNFHVIYPSKPPWVERGKDLLRSSLLRGDSRIRLLNCISDAPVDCPVAVIFGHANVMNWAGPSFNDIGTQLTDLFWQAGLYADLIPSTEIAEKALRVDDNGDVWYGKQRYAAVVLYRPEFENAATVEFFQRAARGKTILCRIGEWTKDFNGKPLDANAALPPPMKGAVDITTCAREVIAKLTEAGVQPKTPASGMFPKWNGQGRESADMPASGHTRLTDGTVILVAGEKDRTGDPIQETIEVHGHKVTFDAAGVAAVRLSEDGKLEAMAAGGLRHFKAGPVEIKLDQPADVALWRDPKGTLQGVLQGYEGDVPADLAALTSNWLRLELPPRLNEN